MTHVCLFSSKNLTTIDFKKGCFSNVNSPTNSHFFQFNIEDDGEEGEDDDEEEEDYVGTEPKLKYERLSCDLKTILADDSASAIAVHPKFMVLGELSKMSIYCDRFKELAAFFEILT